MKKLLTGTLAALTLAGAMTATTALPAAAADHHARVYHRGYDRGWRGPGAAGAALLGLGVGAAIAGAYDPYYGPYYGAPRCRMEMRWNPYWGGYDRVRVCY